MRVIGLTIFNVSGDLILTTGKNKQKFARLLARKFKIQDSRLARGIIFQLMEFFKLLKPFCAGLCPGGNSINHEQDAHATKQPTTIHELEAFPASS